MKAPIFIITGTDTDVGKTIATAALSLWLQEADQKIFVIKPVQSGVLPGERGDIDTVIALSGLPEDCGVEGVRLPEPLAPTHAAHRAGISMPSISEHAEVIADLAKDCDAILVEGAGGVAVELDDEGQGLIDLAHELQSKGLIVHAIVVTRAGLGTLNHTRLTLNFLSLAGIAVDGLIIGALPDEDDISGQLNVEELSQDPYPPLLMALPQGLGALDHDAFVATLKAHWEANPVVDKEGT